VVPGDTVTLRGGPWHGELCLSAHVVTRDGLQLSVFDVERGLRHQYDATGTAHETENGWNEIFRYCGTFGCPEDTQAALDELIARATLR
jgi:hypothetical protein